MYFTFFLIVPSIDVRIVLFIQINFRDFGNSYPYVYSRRSVFLCPPFSDLVFKGNVE